MLKKIGKKNIFFCAGPPPPPELHKRIFFFQIHVSRYIEFCFFFKSMYPGTWNFDISSNPCTRVHDILIIFSLFLCVAQAVGVGQHKKKKIANFFLTCEKINQFWEFREDQGVKI